MTGLGTVILDCEALSQLLRDDRIMVARIKAAQVRGARVLVCAMTVIEAAGARIRPERVTWTLSGLNVEPVT